jgi:hypothetical protein
VGFVGQQSTEVKYVDMFEFVGKFFLPFCFLDLHIVMVLKKNEHVTKGSKQRLHIALG